MAERKYILRKVSPDRRQDGRIKQNNLFNLSSIGMRMDNKLIKSSLAYGASENQEYGHIYDYINDNRFIKVSDITRANDDFIAFFDQSYVNRREMLKQFSQNEDIGLVLDIVCDEAIVVDEHNYFCSLNIDRLKTSINKNYRNANKLINVCEQAFKRVYSMYGWDISNTAWDYMRKFLVEGVLAFEIIYEYDENKNATNIIAFKELDPVTLEPDIVKDEFGNDIKIWYQNRGDMAEQRIIPDSNIVYISWAKGNLEQNQRVSYVETLVRPYNMLRQLENSRIIWNIQNAQRRMKMVVPVGSMSIDRQKQRLAELKATFTEETMIDDYSGEITVNGMPKFSFTRTYMFPSTEGGGTTEIGELGVEGYDMTGTDQLNYFVNRFIMASKVPANRFTLSASSPAQNQGLLRDENSTKEEYGFERFINRIRSIFKELIIKPMWCQVCLQMPEISRSNYFRTYLGITYIEENLFALAKARKIASDGANIVGQLVGLMGSDQKPIFSVRFLLKKYMGLSDDDWKLNQAYLQGDAIKGIKDAAKQQAQNPNGGQPGAGPDMAGGPDMGMVMGGPDMGMPDMGMPDMGGPDMGMDMGGAPDMSGMDMSGPDMGGSPEMDMGM